jgi:general secretion pathway protein A
LFATETHRAALGAIEYGIAAGKGFMVVTGEVGVGKTTVLRSCLDALDASRTKIIYLFSPALNTSELYATILDEFDVILPPTSNAADTLRILQRTLLAVHESGTQVVLAVDEAQQMPEATLESLRILSNLETHKSKLLQIILVGQPELEAVLARHSLRQLAQRIAVRARIKPLSFRQSCRYILHRTRCAGRSRSRPLFTAPALFYLAFAARGLPRTINICCDNALINGYGHAAKRITLGIVRESCRGMKFRAPVRRAAAMAVGAMAMAAMVLVGLFVSGSALLHYVNTPRPRASPTQGQPADPQRPPQTTAHASPADASPVHTQPPTADAESVDAVRAAQVPPEAPASPPGGELASEATPPAPKGSQWLVREGDTLYKACRVTYGSCDKKALQEIIAKNPEIGPDAKIYEGQVLFFPLQTEAATPN